MIFLFAFRTVLFSCGMFSTVMLIYHLFLSSNMSTKVTIAYALPSEHNEDFHLYFDYADFQVHLQIDGREVPLPSRLQAWIYNIWRTWEAIEGIYLELRNPDLLYTPPVGSLRKKSEDLHDSLRDCDIPSIEW